MHSNKLPFPRIIGHRGACGHAPENTSASLIKANNLGLQAVEFDLRLSADGEVILFHDALLDRTTNAHGRVFDRCFQSLSELDAGSWFHASFSDQRIPRLVDVIQLLQQLQLLVILDIKVNETQELAISNKLVEILDHYWPYNLAQPVLSSFSLDCLAQLKPMSNKYAKVLLLDEYRSDWKALCGQFECTAIHINHQILNEKWLAEINQANIAVRAYTVNDLALAEKLFADGVESIITDFPDRMSKYINT